MEYSWTCSEKYKRNLISLIPWNYLLMRLMDQCHLMDPGMVWCTIWWKETLILVCTYIMYISFIIILFATSIQGVIDILVTLARNEVISFPIYLVFVRECLYLRNPSSSSFNMNAYFDPFHNMLWLVIGVFCFLTSLVLYFTMK